MERNDSQTSWTFPNIRLRSIHGFIGITGGPHPTQIMQICMIHNVLQLMQSYKSLATCKSLDRRPLQLQFCVGEGQGVAVLVQFGVKKMAARRGDWHVSLISEAAALIGGASCQSSSPPIVPLPAASGLTVTSLYGHEPPCVRKREWRMLSWTWFHFIYY